MLPACWGDGGANEDTEVALGGGGAGPSDEEDWLGGRWGGGPPDEKADATSSYISSCLETHRKEFNAREDVC